MSDYIFVGECWRCVMEDIEVIVTFGRQNNQVYITKSIVKNV